MWYEAFPPWLGLRAHSPTRHRSCCPTTHLPGKDISLIKSVLATSFKSPLSFLAGTNMNLFCFAFSDKMKGYFSLAIYSPTTLNWTLKSSYWISFIHCLPTQHISLLFGVVLLAPNKDPFYTYISFRKFMFSRVVALIFCSDYHSTVVPRKASFQTMLSM